MADPESAAVLAAGPVLSVPAQLAPSAQVARPVQNALPAQAAVVQAMPPQQQQRQQQPQPQPQVRPSPPLLRVPSERMRGRVPVPFTAYHRDDRRNQRREMLMLSLPAAACSAAAVRRKRAASGAAEGAPAPKVTARARNVALRACGELLADGFPANVDTVQQAVGLVFDLTCEHEDLGGECLVELEIRPADLGEVANAVHGGNGASRGGGKAAATATAPLLRGVDRVQYDLNEPLNSPEALAEALCADALLPRECAISLAAALRGRVAEARSAVESDRSSEGDGWRIVQTTPMTVE